MTPFTIKPIGAPGSPARLEQQRGELYDLLGAVMLRVGLNPTESQTLAVADAIMRASAHTPADGGKP